MPQSALQSAATRDARPMNATCGEPIPSFRNVFLDAGSAYRWDDINERVFISRVLDALRGDLADRFDALTFFIFSPARGASRPVSADLDVTDKVLIFISDEASSVPISLAADYIMIFKAYLPHDLPAERVLAFNLGYIGDPPAVVPLPFLERPIDIFFSGNLNINRLALYAACHPAARWLTLPHAVGRIILKWPLRRLLRADFSADRPGFRSYIRFTRGFKAGLSAADYAVMLGRSKIVLCPRGFTSTETFRHIEAMRAGAIIASETLPDTHLYYGAPMIRVTDWRSGLAQVRAVLADPAALADLAARSRDWYETVLSERATARFMAAALGGARPAAVDAVETRVAAKSC